MSKVGKYNLTCPHCKNKFLGVLYETLNVTLDPISYDMVKSGEALSVKCPNCNNVINVNHPLLYNDMDNKFMVYYLPNSLNMEESIKIIETIKNAYSMLDSITYRIVIGEYARFIEKIDILTCNLNDIAMELYKMMIHGFLKENIDNMFFVYENEKKLLYLLINNEWKTVDFIQEIYDACVKELENKPFYNSKDNYVVDNDILKYIDSNKEFIPRHIEILEEAKKGN